MLSTLLREDVFYAKPLQIPPKCVILIDACAGVGLSRTAYLPCAKRTCYQKGLLCIGNITMSEFLASIHLIAVCLIVCFAKIVEITIQSLKTCMMVKGLRLKAAEISKACTLE